MVKQLGDMGSRVTPVGVTIAARDEDEANKIKTAILGEFGRDIDPNGLTDEDFDIMGYDNRVPDGRLGTEAYRFDAVAGIREVTMGKEPKVCNQAK